MQRTQRVQIRYVNPRKHKALHVITSQQRQYTVGYMQRTQRVQRRYVSHTKCYAYTATESRGNQ